MSGLRTLTLALPPTAQAARAGRRFVTAVLADWGAADLADRVVLLTSELITNAVLHARTPVTLSVADLPGGAVRVTVADASPRLPQRLQPDRDAGTGRGLTLLGELAQSWSTGRHGCGKQVSFVVGPHDSQHGSSADASAGPPPVSPRPAGAAGSLLGRYTPTGSDPADERPVRLLGVPVGLYVRSRQHHDDLIGECAVLAVARPELLESLPDELAHLVDVLGYRYGTPDRRTDDPVDAARAAGQNAVDLEFAVPAHAAAAAGRLEQLLAEADRLSRSGALLMLPRRPELVMFAGWYTGEIRRQLAGEPARPWADGDGW